MKIKIQRKNTTCILPFLPQNRPIKDMLAIIQALTIDADTPESKQKHHIRAKDMPILNLLGKNLKNEFNTISKIVTLYPEAATI